MQQANAKILELQITKRDLIEELTKRDIQITQLKEELSSAKDTSAHVHIQMKALEEQYVKLVQEMDAEREALNTKQISKDHLESTVKDLSSQMEQYRAEVC